ncbi:class I SAM-dependent methyltransferase [Aquitalea aquatica]|uniref:Methyltransferase domain-containing protein n=1 Tax=Aquitalea aquatica TaxID=3044273 RepID=A0A838Y6Q2_9NEIS|nr:class I SAM-dependent methyltransferase [Aquitalea magnusonii]MBA4709528.1 methyltransferase domain-containing protein [Aquitalea magnusonii]
MQTTTINALYTDPRLIALYDVLNAGCADHLFYTEQIGTESRAVVDIGCGTGVLAVRLAQLGHSVTGIDPAAAMLEVARARRGGGQVCWLGGTAADLPLDARFDVALMTGHAFQCLLTDEAVQEMLGAVRRHLRPGGVLMFESRNPASTPWQRWSSKQSRQELALADGERLVVWHALQDVDDELVCFDTHYHFQGADVRLCSRSVLRFMSHAAIAGQLRLAGVKRLDWYGDWRGGALTMQSAEMIAMARFD